MLTQIPGGYIIAKKGGRKILPLGVGLWSLATAAVPVMAGTMPGMVLYLYLLPVTYLSQSREEKSWLSDVQQSESPGLPRPP